MELLTPEEMGRADALAMAAGRSGAALMERAGTAVADAVARYPLSTRVAVVCGPGNNGGDGFVAARILAQRGFRVTLGLLGERDRLRGDAAAMAALWRGEVLPAAELDIGSAGIVVDALFGAGLARDLDGEAKSLVERINAAGRPVIAVDLPSGIDGASGAVRGAAIRAQESVTFFRRKPGHLLLPGRVHCGRVRVADIGIPDAVLDTIGPRTFVNEPELWKAHFPVPRIEGHKYTRGHLVAVSGPAQATGATRLAARAALRAGAGLVTVACPADALAIHAANLSAIMVRPADTPDDLAALLSDRRLGTVVLGPGAGIGEGTRRQLAVASGRRLVVDADALSSFAGEPERLADILSSAPAAIVTPHDGEFARLFAGRPEILDPASKVDRARAAAALLGAAVVLKGPDTVAAAPDGRAAIACNAPPWLATAGAGDVLSGICGGLLSQGMPAFEAAAAAVWLHGEAAREAGPGLVADDLIDALRPVYARFFAALGVLD
ncbi:bifunctional ADP-dependent NAD(P)H-hydrate dehydratase/NAD(P)H-hydrate epimerase [Bosea sp. 117]|uniref:bifunctional ADP-dependent NAD(P)H-hydrate dehydratase/NAD(P)H-hydrate epimerase n=1 Tax=Bosea sp. 117 TaxID=1125973 RepID=UPI0004941E65|nr:bifunctional ADP-dependent NAD(P)H-hydrate dehydratase/NAD(P)H-hydrate epimerase [Bosea sp. 117]